MFTVEIRNGLPVVVQSIESVEDVLSMPLVEPRRSNHDELLDFVHLDDLVEADTIDIGWDLEAVR